MHLPASFPHEASCCCNCDACTACMLLLLLLPLQVRTSTGTFFNKDYDEVVSAVEDRVALVTMLPKANQEGLQVLKYVDGQKYEPHHGKPRSPLQLLTIGCTTCCSACMSCGEVLRLRATPQMRSQASSNPAVYGVLQLLTIACAVCCSCCSLRVQCIAALDHCVYSVLQSCTVMDCASPRCIMRVQAGAVAVLAYPVFRCKLLPHATASSMRS
eukprot:GHRQ01022481.1.p1 GENE.GHRQ01022481.1~~GHRQ01022481.1.p1  ORF type:complete len:214 (+),score=60.29 GHRQ01022481.1:12-653(+)